LSDSKDATTLPAEPPPTKMTSYAMPASAALTKPLL
jgi:hypothetical protein